MTGRGRRSGVPEARLALLGLLVVLAAGTLLYVSYTANDGLPFARATVVTVEVPNADRLVRRDTVRIGGVRVGQVRDVQPAPLRDDRAPTALITLALDPEVGRLPLDTRVKVRPASILGASYIDVRPGASRETLRDGGTLPLEQALPAVQATELFDVFDRSTGTALRRSINAVATGTAARGPDLNATIQSTADLLAPLSRVSRVLSAPDTGLGRLVRAAAQFSTALRPVRTTLGAGTTALARTTDALAAEQRALGAAIDEAPGALRELRAAMRETAPALDQLATASTGLRAATPGLARTTGTLNGVLLAGIRPLQQLPTTARHLTAALQAIDRASRRPSTSGVLRRGREALVELDSILDVLTPAQLQCNVAPVWAQNFAAGFGSLGFGDGPAIATVGVSHLGAQGESLQNATPSPNVAINNQPKMNTQECEAGNEPYDGSRVLGNPAGLQPDSTLTTRPPLAARERARTAGLLEPVGGGR